MLYLIPECPEYEHHINSFFYKITHLNGPSCYSYQFDLWLIATVCKTLWSPGKHTVALLQSDKYATLMWFAVIALQKILKSSWFDNILPRVNLNQWFLKVEMKPGMLI